MRAALNAPKHLGSAGFTPLQAEAGAGYVLHFITHWRCQHEDASRAVRIVSAWSQYQAGVSFPILEYPDIALPYIEGRYLPAVRKHLDKIGGKIHLLQMYVIPKLRTKDISLMERALTLGYTNAQLH